MVLPGSIISIISILVLSIILAAFLFFSKRPVPKLYKDLRTLNDHIQEFTKKGLNDAQMTERLKSVGWPEHVVELVLHEAHKPGNRIEKLQEYVKAQVLKARPKEQIKETLLDAGWSEDIVDVVLGIE